jgi:hypothetical protein
MGLLGSMVAGATKKFADGRVNDIEQREEFDMKVALIEAQAEKEMRLKEAGYELDKRKDADARAGAAERMDDAFAPVEETSTTPQSTMTKYTDESGVEHETKVGGETVTKTREATTEEAAQRLARSGDTEAAKGLLSVSTKKEKTFDSIKLDDGSVMSFDKSTGKGQIILEGGGKMDVPKNEFELAWKEAGGDPKLAGEILVRQKSRIAAAGRAPDKQSDDDLTYADWKKKPANKNKGRDDYAKEKASWGKDTGIEEVTEETSTNEFGDTEKKTKVTSRRPAKTSAPTKAKPWERQY